MGYVSKNSNTRMRKKCSTCQHHKIKEHEEPCCSCIKLKDPATFSNYKENRVIQVSVTDDLGTHILQAGDYTVICRKCRKERPLYESDLNENAIEPMRCKCGGDTYFSYWLDGIYTEEEYKKLEEEAKRRTK